MAENNDNDRALVQRSVFLERYRDEELREMAHKLRMSKNELIRQLLTIGFRHNQELGGAISTAETSTAAR